jgi:hypothetical protein
MAEENRNKTQRNLSNVLDISGAAALGFSEKTFQALNNDAVNALKRPWHKLERGLRIGRIREFVSREKARFLLSDNDSDALFKLLSKSLQDKLLSNKAAVTYDFENEQITEIKGLVSHTTASGQVIYQLLEKKTVQTLKKKSKRNPD